MARRFCGPCGYLLFAIYLVFAARAGAVPQEKSSASQDVESLDLATKLENQGKAAQDRGDLTGAENFHQRALAIREKLAPESLEVASSVNNLGNVAHTRRDLDKAEDYYKRALALREDGQTSAMRPHAWGPNLLADGAVFLLRGR